MKSTFMLRTLIVTVLVTSMTGGMSTAIAQDAAEHDDLLQWVS